MATNGARQPIFPMRPMGMRFARGLPIGASTIGNTEATPSYLETGIDFSYGEGASENNTQL